MIPWHTRVPFTEREISHVEVVESFHRIMGEAASTGTKVPSIGSSIVIFLGDLTGLKVAIHSLILCP